MITTKKQELKALAKIREIVENLGEGSYLKTAFGGAFEVAEQNIMNDWGCSIIGQAEHMQRRAEDKLQEAEKVLLEAKEIEKKYEVDKMYWEDIRRLLDRAAYQLSDKLGY